jgi:hypothetical protein
MVTLSEASAASASARSGIRSMKWVALVVLVACQGNRDRDPGGNGIASNHVEPGPEAAPVFEMPEAGTAAPDDAKLDDPEPDPGKVIAELGAIPAWQAVIDRAQLLGRRNQHGVVYGRVGAAILMPGPPEDPLDAGVSIDGGLVPSPYVWLVDDTEGNGSLGIRIALGGKSANAGDRIAVGGAWQLDDQRRWYWKVDSLQSLPPAPATDLKDPPWPEPGHEPPPGAMPWGTKPITLAKDGEIVYFQLVGPSPANEGDGWLVAKELGDTPFALLTMPGERSSYGGQDMRAADERWQLKRATTYWVRIGRIVTRDGKPALVRARTGPVRHN